MITVNRTSDHLRDHVIGRAESDGAEPEKQQIIRVPPAHCRLQNTLYRDDKKHQLTGRIEPREPEERAQQIPLRDVNLVAAPMPEHEHRPGRHERVSDEKDNGHVARKLEPLKTGAIAEQNCADAYQHANVPERHRRRRATAEIATSVRHNLAINHTAVPIPAIDAQP